MAKTIEKITFNVNIDGRWYNRVNVGISANNGYTDEDISSTDGSTFSTRIGHDYYDVKVYKPNDNYAVKLKLLQRSEKSGNWEIAKEQKKQVRINNLKVKFCQHNFR